MDQITAQLLSVIIGGAVGFSASLLTTSLNNRHQEKRHRRELAAQAKRNKEERKSSFAQSLLEPRIKAHEAIFARLYDLQIATHYFLLDKLNPEYEQEFKRAKNAFKVTGSLTSIWLRTAALEMLTQIGQKLDNIQSPGANRDELERLFAEAGLRIYCSIGLEDLESYLRELWGADATEPQEA